MKTYFWSRLSGESINKLCKFLLVKLLNVQEMLESTRRIPLLCNNHQNYLWRKSLISERIFRYITVSSAFQPKFLFQSFGDLFSNACKYTLICVQPAQYYHTWGRIGTTGSYLETNSKISFLGAGGKGWKVSIAFLSLKLGLCSKFSLVWSSPSRKEGVLAKNNAQRCSALKCWSTTRSVIQHFNCL